MRRARTSAHILIFASLLLIGSLVWTGCGGNSSTISTSTANAVLADSIPFVASAIPANGTEGGMAQVGDITQTRNATSSYIVDATDPRLSGTFAVVYNTDQAPDGTMTRFFGNWKLTNDKGSWVCDSWTGAADAVVGPNSTHFFTVGVGKGTGAYEGLVSVWQWYWPLNDSRNSGSTALPLIAGSGWSHNAP